jgi:hypothetical protein
MCVLFDTLTFMSAPNINGILESDMSSIGKKNENKRKNSKCIKPIHLTSFGTKMDHIICMSLSFSSSISSVYYEFVYGIRDIGKPHSLIPNGIVDSNFFFFLFSIVRPSWASSTLFNNLFALNPCLLRILSSF